MDQGMSELPPGYILEDEFTNMPKAASVEPPPGYVLEGSEPRAVPLKQQVTPRRTSAMDLAVQGMTFGFSDELLGGKDAAGGLISSIASDIKSGKSPDWSKAADAAKAAYETSTAENRAGLKQYREESPILSTGAEVVGGLAALPGAGMAKGAEFLGRLPAWLKASGLGALYGGAYGAGTAEGDLQDRALGLGAGATVGGATGGLAHGVIRGGQAIYGKARGGLERVFNPEQAASRKLAEAIARDEKTPARLAARLKDLGPQATLADAGGENVLGLARAAASVPGPAKNRAAMVLNQRAEAEASRISTAVGKGLKPQDYFAAEDTFLSALKDNAAPLYEKAYEAGKSLSSPELNSLLNRPVAKQAMKEAAALAQIEGRRVSPLVPELTEQAKLSGAKVLKGGIGKGVTTEAIDDLKRGIDTLIERESNELTGKLNKKGYALSDFKRQLMRETDRLNPHYKTARAQYAGDAEVLNSLRDGRDFMKLDAERIARKVHDLSDAAKEAYRSGAARAVKDIVENTPDQSSAARKLFGKSITRQKIKAVFPEGKFGAFAKSMVAEQQFAKTKAGVLSGSRTTPLAAEMDDLKSMAGNVGAILGSQSPFGHALVASGIGRKIAERAAQGMLGAAPEQELAKMLFSRNQAANQRVLDDLVKRGLAPNREMANAIIQAVVAGLTQQEGRLIGGQNQRP